MKGFGKSFLSVIIALAMVITSMACPGMKLLPDKTVQASAATADYGIVWPNDDETDTRVGSYIDENGVRQEITFTKWTDELAASQNGAGKTASNSLPGVAGNYYLCSDVTITAIWNAMSGISIPAWTAPSGTTTLCLNGKTISADYSGDSSRYSDAIRLDNCTLNLYDTNVGGGSITSTSEQIHELLLLRMSFLNMYGGDIKGLNYSGNIASVPVYLTTSTFTMNGGSITNNHSNNACGIAISTSSHFILSRGSITGNTTTNNNYGAVYLSASNAIFEMSGGSITNNTGSRGGVSFGYGTFAMTGGEISGNTYTTGEIVNVYYNSTNGATFTMTGGNIDGGVVAVNNDIATVTFNKNDGTNTSSSLYIKKNTETVLNQSAYSIIGDTQLGWNTETNGNGIHYDINAPITLADNLVLYAEWASQKATAPTIVTQPSDLSMTYGYTSSNTLSVSAEAAADRTYSLSYQWYNCDDTTKNNPQPITGATGENYTISTGKNATTEYYYCAVTATRADNGARTSALSDVATVTVNKKEVTVSGITAENKEYDGTATATLDLTNVTIDGKVAGDDLTVSANGEFESAEAGDNKTVNISNLSLSGTDADNYVLASSGQQNTTTANITTPASNTPVYVPEPEPEPVKDNNNTIKTFRNDDGSVTTVTTTKNPDGSTIATEKTEYEDGSYTLVSETRDKDGKLLTKTEETKTISKKGTATVKTKTVNAKGSTLEKTVKTTKKGYVETSTIASEVTKKGNTLVTVTMTNSDGYALSMSFTVKAGTVTLTSFEATEGIVTIPNEITVNGETIPVAAILKAAFKNNTDITNVSIGKNVTVIGTKAFYGAKNLNKIFIYGNLEKVAKGAFKKIAEDALIKIKADKENYKRIVELIKASGVGKGVKFKRIK